MKDNSLEKNEIDEIALTLLNKNRRALRDSSKLIVRQVAYVIPIYRPYFHQLISNNSLKIQACSESNLLPECTNSLKMFSKKAKNHLNFDIRVPDNLLHELGHAVDFWFGLDQALTKTLIIIDDKTLRDIFVEEFKGVHKILYDIVMDDYRNVINATIGDRAHKIISDNIEKYKKLCEISPNLRNKEITNKRRMIQKELYDSGFVEMYYQLRIKKHYLLINRKYSPIIDALTSIYDLKGLGLFGHEFDYYQKDDDNLVYEFFANLFSIKLASPQDFSFDYLIKYLPKSYEGFEKLFNTAYDHFTNNKSFKDVKCKRSVH